MVIPRYNTKPSGFTLLELIIVLAGLSILSSLAIPNVIRFITFANIDEAKSLLNSAAADCLQKGRFETSDKDQLDANILSDTGLISIGFKINPSAKKCSFAELIPTDPEDTIRYPIGFAIIDNRVFKRATPTSTDQASISSCQSWAGDDCKQDEEMKRLVEYLEKISKAKTLCMDNYNKKLSAAADGPISSWNPAATIACPSRPPLKIGSGCTIGGCNRTVYALNGKIVGTTQEQYDEAVERELGKACSAEIQRLRLEKFTNPSASPKLIGPCKTRKFWFHEGTELSDADAWRSKMCTAEVNKNIDTVGIKQFNDYCGDRKYYFCDGKDQRSQANYDACIANNAEAKCIADRETARTSGHKGKYGPNQGPGACGEVKWMCNKVMMDNENTYNNSNCALATRDCIPYKGDPYYCAWKGWSIHPNCNKYCL